MNRSLVCVTWFATLVTAACREEPQPQATEPLHPDAVTEGPRGALDPRAPSAPDPAAPPVIESHDACVLSADCPAGQHCDLGECIQECNAELACAAGERCSLRARCLGEAEADEDPRPTTKRLGSLVVSQSAATLTDRDESLAITLKSDSPEPVRYRLQVDAPHLRVIEPRGVFVGETTLALPVEAGAGASAEGTSTVRIFTTLGDSVVSAPVRVGITGRYEGRMAYRVGSLPLGTVTAALSIREDSGNLRVRIDGGRSLLFPAVGEESIGGAGTYRLSRGAEFVVEHDVPSDLGGDRNRFKRRITRRVRFRLKPDAMNNLEGQFEEHIEGLLSRPVTLEGTVLLRREGATRGVDFDAPAVEVGEVDVSDAPLPLADAFPGWERSSCKSILNPSTARGANCNVAGGPLPGDCVASLHYWASVADTLYYRVGRGEAKLSLGELAAQCATELTTGPKEFPVEPACAAVPRLACALTDVAGSEAHDPLVSDAFAQLFSHVLEPALMASQDELVRGTMESFVHGPVAHAGALSTASDMLRGSARWVMQPQVLEYLARVVHFGAPPSRGGNPSHVDALRKLGRLFFVQSTIDGELARTGALDPTTREQRIARAQQGGLLTLLEAAAIAAVLERWGESAPADLGTELTDVLTPIEQGYRSLLDGNVVFGVPEGFVPFVQERGTSSTNFARVLASMEPRLVQFGADAEAFVQSKRTFESNDHALEGELTQVRTEMEQAIAGICGDAFQFSDATEDDDWAACGEGWAGEAGEHRLAIEQARNRLQAAYARAQGLSDRIEIRTRMVQEIKEIRDGTVAFVDKTGKELVETDKREGLINATQKMVEIAAEANALNFGAPLAHAAIASILESQRTSVQVDRRNLETAKEMRIRGDDALAEQKRGLAEIQEMQVDLAQLVVEMRQDVLGLLQSQVTAMNAVARARRLNADRLKVMAHIEKSPFWDPSFRIVAERAALQAVRSRFAAQQGLYQAGRALEYDLNQPLGDAVSRAVFNVFNAEEAARLRNCFETIAGEAAIAKGQGQPYVTEVSLRKVLGINGERHDAVTGQVLTPGDQFRRVLLENDNLDGSGGAGVAFASSALQGNGLWPVNVCDDKIASVSAQLVGDFLGDDDAQVELALEDGGVLRRCDEDELVNWATSGRSVIQAGVNTFGAAAPNRSLQGLSVASSRFRLTIPGPGIAPANADLDLRNLEDVVLRVEHEARPRGENRTPISLECLSRIGQVR